MTLVFLSGPISRGNQCVNGATAGDAMLRLMQSGVAVINPMLSMWCGAESEILRLDGDYPARPSALAHGGFRSVRHEEWLAMDKEILSRCDAVLRLPGESSGADEETAHAHRKGIPVFHDMEQLIRWCNHGGR